MDLELLLFCDMTQGEYAIYIKDLFESMDVTFHFVQEEDYISLCFSCMTMIFDFEEVFGLDIVEEEFGFKASVSATIQIFGKYINEGIEIIFRLIKKIINRGDFNLILLESSENVIVKRNGNKYYYSALDDYAIRIPYELLEVEVEELER